MEKISFEATEYPFRKCKGKIHDLESEDKNFGIVYKKRVKMRISKTLINSIKTLRMSWIGFLK
jgi:hypothetical protein